MVAAADAAYQERRPSVSKPTKNPFLPEDKQPVMECRTCEHWDNKTGYADWVRGKCRHTGLTIVPPRHVCEAWTKRRKVRKEDEE